MSENRRRFRNKKRDETRTGPSPSVPVTIARREDTRSAVQPKILLKKDAECSAAGSNSSNSNSDLPAAAKTIIINRSERPTGGAAAAAATTTATAGSTSTGGANSANVCAALSSANKEEQQQQQQLPPRMTRPTPLLVSNGVFNANAKKLFHKTNTDFTVVGVLGGQGIGKSTLLNLLAVEQPSDYDYYQQLFGPEASDCIFPIRHRSKPVSKNVLRSRTDTMQFFVTRERYVLLDSAPLLAGCSVKDADHLDLQTLATITQLLSVCHVLLLVMDGVCLEQLRLLHAALRLRPRSFSKCYIRDYLPQIMFVRTRALRQHYEPEWRTRWHKQLTLLFEGTRLPIHRGRGEARALNSFIFPEISGNAATSHHACVPELVRQFRERVFSSVRVSMCNSHDFSESLWFELLAEVNRKCTTTSQNFEKIYGETKQRHFDVRSKWRADHNWRNES